MALLTKMVIIKNQGWLPGIERTIKSRRTKKWIFTVAAYIKGKIMKERTDNARIKNKGEQ